MKLNSEKKIYFLLGLLIKKIMELESIDYENDSKRFQR